MINSNVFWNASVEELKKGFVLNAQEHCYICLICGESFEDGVIYPMDAILFDAKRAVEKHIEKKHPPIFAFYLGLGKDYTGLSASQTELARLFFEGYSDKEIVEKTGVNSASTIRNQRFLIREKYKQAKILVTLVEMLEEKMEHARQERKISPDHSKLVDFHRTATAIDERYAVTQAEKEEVLGRYFSPDNQLLIKTIPAKEKTKIIIMQKIIQDFEANRQYPEKKVNEILKRYYDDFASIRRYLVSYGFLDRSPDGENYWVKL